jgi:hypothetical protein
VKRRGVEAAEALADFREVAARADESRDVIRGERIARAP